MSESSLQIARRFIQNLREVGLEYVADYYEYGVETGLLFVGPGGRIESIPSGEENTT